MRARWRSASSTAKRSKPWVTDSSWLTAGASLITTRLRTGTGRETTFQKSWAEQEKMARPRVVERSMPPRTYSSMRWRSRATEVVPFARDRAERRTRSSSCSQSARRLKRLPSTSR